MPVAENCRISDTTKIPYPDLVNMYGCTIGDGCFIGPFVEIQSDVRVGRESRIQSHAFLCSGVEIGDRVFVGHGVLFVNDRYPVANNPQWKLETTKVENDVSIGSGAVIMCGITIGAGSLIGAGAVVTHDVPPNSIAKGNPAKFAPHKAKNGG